MSVVFTGTTPIPTTFVNATRASTARVIPFPAVDRLAAPEGPASQPSRSSSMRLHLTRRGRVVLTTLAAVPLVVAAVFFAVNSGGAVASADAGDDSFMHVTVSSGQSLWQIAERVAPSADPRDVVASIIDLNQLPSSLVMPGERLAIPTQYAR